MHRRSGQKLRDREDVSKVERDIGLARCKCQRHDWQGESFGEAVECSEPNLARFAALLAPLAGTGCLLMATETGSKNVNPSHEAGLKTRPKTINDMCQDSNPRPLKISVITVQLRCACMCAARPSPHSPTNDQSYRCQSTTEAQ